MVWLLGSKFLCSLQTQQTFIEIQVFSLGRKRAEKVWQKQMEFEEEELVLTVHMEGRKQSEP